MGLFNSGPDIVPTGTFDWERMLIWPGVEVWAMMHSNCNLMLRNEGRILPCEATVAPEVLQDEVEECD